jgi:hypothetical protein
MNRISDQLGLNFTSCKKIQHLIKELEERLKKHFLGKLNIRNQNSEKNLSTLEKEEDLLRLQDDSLHSTIDSTTRVLSTLEKEV